MPFYVEITLSDGGEARYLRLLQLLRLVRLRRLYSQLSLMIGFRSGAEIQTLYDAVLNSVSAILSLLLWLGISAIIFSFIIFEVEGGVYDESRQQYVREDGSASPFESSPAAMWWSTMTLLKTGYGDLVPVTSWGRLVAVRDASAPPATHTTSHKSATSPSSPMMIRLARSPWVLCDGGARSAHLQDGIQAAQSPRSLTH